MKNEISLIRQRIEESIEVKKRILNNDVMLRSIYAAAEMICNSLDTGGKVLFCGNGGSASDALHLSSELTGRFERERKALPAICLNGDVSALTAISNDYGYDRSFARLTEALMRKNDILVGISTSGNSENVYQAIQEASKVSGKTIALLGKDGGRINGIADLSIVVPSENTARIQEAHIMIGHIICEIVEKQGIKADE